MFRHLLHLFCIASLFAVAASAQSTTLSQEMGNNTSACSATGTPSYCGAGFTAMSDSTSGVYNPGPGNVSTESVHELLYSGANTRVFTHFQPWFCMGSSSSTGSGSKCGSHIQVGYNSADSATVHGQIGDMIARGFDGTVVDWYGPQNSALDSATTFVSSDVASRCSGSQNCPFYFALMYDQGAFEYNRCPTNGGGTDQTQCIINAMSSDFDYMNSQYFGSLGYMRVDNSTMQITASGSPVVLFFICESCFTNPAPNWTTIWSALRQHTNTYGANGPNLFMFRNGGAFTHSQSDGGYAWVNWYGSSDPYGLVYLDKFYDSAKSATQNSPSPLTMGGQWKGFDNTNAAWATTPTITGQQCGQTWLQTFKQITYNNDFGSTHQLPFSGVATWNDYEEGTEIETGIDNCLTVSAAVASNSTVLSWTLNFSAPSGAESTVHHYLVFDSQDGTNLTQIAKVAVGTHSLDLSQFSLATGAHTLYVKAVGQPSIQNEMSSGVAYSVNPSVTLSQVSLAPSAIGGSAITTLTVQLSGPAPANGAGVTLSSNSSAVPVPPSVTIPGGVSSATVPITTQTVTSLTQATITAQYGGLQNSATVAVYVTPAAVSFSPAPVNGGQNDTVTVTLTGPAASGGEVVQLQSSSSYAVVPASITVAAGSKSAQFKMSTKRPPKNTSVTISATAWGVSKAGTLMVKH
jgi:hypothetical protein